MHTFLSMPDLITIMAFLMKTIAIVLAAGKGVRMNSDLPKVSHMLHGRPMITRVLEAVEKLYLDKVYVVVGYKADLVKDECKAFDVAFVEQREQLGTGHAVMQVAPFVKETSMVLVLNGDMPLIKDETLRDFISAHRHSGAASATVLTANLSDPGSYGRIVKAADGSISRIVEKKDASAEELAIKEINTGTYCFNSNALFEALKEVKSDNAQKEYYLTDVIGILRKKGLGVSAFIAPEAKEVLGVNTIEELKELEALF